MDKKDIGLFLVSFGLASGMKEYGMSPWVYVPTAVISTLVIYVVIKCCVGAGKQ